MLLHNVKYKCIYCIYKYMTGKFTGKALSFVNNLFCLCFKRLWLYCRNFNVLKHSQVLKEFQFNSKILKEFADFLSDLLVNVDKLFWCQAKCPRADTSF